MVLTIVIIDQLLMILDNDYLVLIIVGFSGAVRTLSIIGCWCYWVLVIGCWLGVWRSVETADITPRLHPN